MKRHGHGVWGHPDYKPSPYEVLQVRAPKAVFWGPSALWLLGIEAEEPEPLWVAIGNKSRVPRDLDVTTLIIRTRRLEEGVVSLCPERRLISLRVHRRERAEADLARADCRRLLARAADRELFAVPREASFLSADLPVRSWSPFKDDWVSVSRSLLPER